MVTITKKDNLCMARVLIMCNECYKGIVRHFEKFKMYQTIAIELCQCAGIPTDRMVTLNDIPKFEEALQLHNIITTNSAFMALQ